MDNINKYIDTLIKTPPCYTLTKEDEKIIKFEGLEKYIFNKLLSKKYRVSTLDDNMKKSVTEKIGYCLENNLPIHLSLPFGANKLWKLPTYPHIDWAEIFNIILLREYIAPIAKAYSAGVIMHYYSVELFAEKTNGIPQQQTDKYQKEFLELLSFMSNYLPKGMTLKFTNLREEIDSQEALRLMDEKASMVKKEWSQMNRDEQNLLIKRAKVNCFIEKSDPDYENKILESVFYHKAFSSEYWNKNAKIDWAFAKDMIAIGNSYTKGWAIHLKSSKSSRVNFWVGIGALKKHGSSYIPTILSYEQYKKHKSQLEVHEINIKDLSFKNYNEIHILD